MAGVSARAKNRQKGLKTGSPSRQKRLKSEARPRYAWEGSYLKPVFYIALFVSILSIFLFPYLYLAGIISINAANADATIGLSLFFPLVVFSYLLAKGRTLKEIVKELGLSREALNRHALMIGVLVFVAILLLEFGISAFQQVTNIKLPTNVAQVFAGLPAYIFAFAVVVAPFDEEVLFRGFLVPRIGIILSALIFGFLHFLSYASISEFVAAFVFGLLAGYAFRKTKSLYSTILPHMLVNVLGVLALLL